ncbi:pyridoxamine 5'-phosphate oxidase-domain-containing protein [Phascolomyces articulosus]|uniref:Pyridoxamine 5'-phosphate oxidase-domain-containing protein n=1 Tax=Phascolomyces articulosus TaxID=60185 RepID=A0AAD5JPM4_9FUNG|nr:pyridoxamine 5'-phosphate oxidase-domain-containing protein [Phascolomyces articulosus]
MTSTSWKTFLSKQLKTNIEQQGLSSTYTSLATVRADGTPANRTVVFRGFAGEDHHSETGWQSELLTMTSAKRSRKMADIAHQPIVEVNWFMGGTQEQFRIHGKCYAVQSNTTAQDLKELEGAVTKINNVKNSSDNQNLATRAFLTRLGDKNNNNTLDWQAERLRQWYRMHDKLRGTFPSSTNDSEPLEIHDMDDQGWFVNHDKEKQRLLEEGYENFALLVIKVECIDHVELNSGAHSIFKQDENGQWIYKKLTSSL